MVDARPGVHHRGTARRHLRLRAAARRRGRLSVDVRTALRRRGRHVLASRGRGDTRAAPAGRHLRCRLAARAGARAGRRTRRLLAGRVDDRDRVHGSARGRQAGGRLGHAPPLSRIDTAAGTAAAGSGSIRRGVRPQRRPRARRRVRGRPHRRGGRHDRLVGRRGSCRRGRGRMTRAGALLLAVAAVAWARNLGQAGAAASVGTALAVGFTLLGAWVAGDLLRRLHLPRLTGYLLFGVLVGPYLGNVITSSMASQLQAITGLATTLIALIAGLTISLERLGGPLSAIVRLTTVTLAVVIIGIGTAAWFAWAWLPGAPESSGLTRAGIRGPLTIMVASGSPTMAAAG